MRPQVRLRMPTAAGELRVDHRSLGQDAVEGPRQAEVQQEVRVHRVEHVVDAHQHQRVMRVAAGRHVERGGELRVAAGEVEDRRIALDPAA